MEAGDFLKVPRLRGVDGTAEQKEDFLSYYAEKFHTVEVNNSFYQLPKKETLETGERQCLKDFFSPSRPAAT